MKETIKCIIEGKLSVRLVAKRYDIPKSSLHDRVKAANSDKEAIFQSKLGRLTAYFLNIMQCNFISILKNWTTV